MGGEQAPAARRARATVIEVVTVSFSPRHDNQHPTLVEFLPDPNLSQPNPKLPTSMSFHHAGCLHCGGGTPSFGVWVLPEPIPLIAAFLDQQCRGEDCDGVPRVGFS